MQFVEDNSAAARSDRWTNVCGVAAFLSFLVIVAHVAFPLMAGVGMAYSGGGAVLLGIGATLSFAVKSRSVRIAVSVGLVCLMILRSLSPTMPDFLSASHGELTTADAGGLALLIFTASLMVAAATGGSSSGRHMTQHSSILDATSDG